LQIDEIDEREKEDMDENTITIFTNDESLSNVKKYSLC